MRLKGKTIGILVGPGYEDLEFWVPYMRVITSYSIHYTKLYDHRPAVEGHLSLVTGVDAGEDLHQGGLSGTISTNQAMDNAPPQIKGYISVV